MGDNDGLIQILPGKEKEICHQKRDKGMCHSSDFRGKETSIYTTEYIDQTVLVVFSQ